MKLPGITKEQFQCYNGRTIEKIDDKMKVYAYSLIKEDNIDVLSDKISNWLSLGWELYGSPGISQGVVAELVHFQAIIMTQKIEEKL